MNKTYELIVNTNSDLSTLYSLIGAYISTHIEKREFDNEYGEDPDEVILNYVNQTKLDYPDYSWWNSKICFNGSDMKSPYGILSNSFFYDKNFPEILFSNGDPESEVRQVIKDKFFKKFNKIVDDIDGSILIDEVKALLDSNVFTERFTESYCKEILSEYESYEKMFSGYVINKVYLPSDVKYTKSMVFYLDEEPSTEIINNMINRINLFIQNYDTLIKIMKMDDHCFIPNNIDDHLNFKILSIDIVEHITVSNYKRFTN